MSKLRNDEDVPKKIYLQYFDDYGEILDADNNEVTWCHDRINKNDVPYIRITEHRRILAEKITRSVDVGEIEAVLEKSVMINYPAEIKELVQAIAKKLGR